MNSETRREVETTNPQGVVERRVETINYESSAGQGQQVKSVDVVHQPHPQKSPNTSGGVLAGAAAAVESTLQSAKEAISR
ncbi:hypothetical protein Patl1_28619 [Pistacia atlantica]|uniref:Uncharacterized protein n=1 Tax=Pistacia atlantica TaxID=434234 RepID=A0ACC1BC11_9ROSI|nr:hypothetical protein Patl1_28619 [Pistacia atlantica]